MNNGVSVSERPVFYIYRTGAHTTHPGSDPSAPNDEATLVLSVRDRCLICRGSFLSTRRSLTHLLFGRFAAA